MSIFTAAAPAIPAEPADPVRHHHQHGGRGVRVLLPVPWQALHHGAAAERQTGGTLVKQCAHLTPAGAALYCRCRLSLSVFQRIQIHTIFSVI